MSRLLLSSAQVKHALPVHIHLLSVVLNQEIWNRHFNEADVLCLYFLCREHYAHLYGPVTLIEDKQPLVLPTDEVDELGPALSTRSSLRNANMFPGVELQHRLKSHIERQESNHWHTAQGIQY